MTDADHFYRQAAAIPLLDRDEEHRLGAAALNGDQDARNKLVRHNIRLAHKVAAYYKKRNPSFEEPDLVSAGIEGVIRAAESYDPAKGTRFSTYAVIWVRQRVRRHIERTHSRVMRVPHKEAYEYFSGRMTLERRRQYEATHFNSLSMDGPVRTSNDTGNTVSLGESLVDEAANVADQAILATLSQRIREILAGPTITETQETIVYAHAGLVAEPIPLAELAEIMNLSDRRVRSEWESALDEIRRQLG